eukprot:m.227978 g.227978  ORF g.227978 m.227978 type:complete len:169 (-) comp11673_c0_seq1:88-594(-)
MATTKNHASLVEEKDIRFLITDCPSDASIDSYLKLLKDNNVVALVRVCQGSYSSKPLVDNGIKVYDWEFEDGDPPPEAIVGKWNKLTAEVFGAGNKGNKVKPCIAVHCVAGLGRAPVMVAISLIESGMSAPDAILFIRQRRRGAINTKQVTYLNHYKRHKKEGGCVIS